MVQANIQFVIDNKEKIQVHGLISVISQKKSESILNDRGGRRKDDISPDVEEETKGEELELDAKNEGAASGKDCEIPDNAFYNKDDFEVDAKEEEGYSEDDQDDDYKEASTGMTSKPRPVLTCLLCDKVFYGQRKNFVSYMRRHTQPFVPCPKCGKQIKERALDKHLKYTHKEKPDIACTFPDCDQMFKQPQTLQNHIRKVHEKEKSLCINCGETVSHLYQHKLTCCPDERTVQEQTCSVCHKSYSSKAQREQHETIVHGSAKACPICGKIVKWLESHMKNKHTERDKPHMCTEDNCGKSFKTTSEVKSQVLPYSLLRDICRFYSYINNKYCLSSHCTMR